MTTTVIEIIAKVIDQTSSGTTSAVKSLSQIEQAGLSMQKTLANVKNMSKVELKASLVDSASSGLSGIINLGKSIAGKTWSVTSKLFDLATAPIRGILDLVKNPIVQTITLMGITTGVSSIVSTYADYEQSLADTKAVTGASDAEIASIGTVVKDLGANTTFSASEVGAGASVLGTAGWTADQITGGLEGIVTMAQAGGVDIATAADINTSTIAQYGLKSSDSGYVGDVLASTAASSKTDISGLGETFKYVGSTASALEFSLEDSAIAVGLLGNAAIDGSQAGTSLRTLFTNLVDPTSDTAAAMDKLGVSLSNDQGEMNSLMDIMLQLRTGFSTLTAEEQAFYAASLAGTEGLSGLLAIANAGEEDFDKLTDSIYGAEGAAQLMADTRVDSLSGDFAALSSAVDGVKISIGERLAPTLRSFVQMATDYVPQIGEAIDSVLADSQMRFTALIEIPEWDSASLGQKITMTWGTMVGDPFSEWWNDSGRDSVISVARNMGNTLGSILSGGLMTLLGIDIGESASEGMQIGKAFMDGFMDGFDFDGIAQGFLKAFLSVASEAAKILPGGESATATSWLAAGALAYGGGKAASAAKTVYDVGSGAWQAGSAVIGAGKSLMTTAGLGSGVLATAGKMIGSAGLLGMAVDGISGASKSEEWLQGNSLQDNIISGLSGILGGTGSGVSGAISGAMKGAAVGSFGGLAGAGIGAVVGGISGAVGGENIAHFATNYMETVSLAFETFWEETGSGTVESVGSFFGNIGLAAVTFCEETGNFFSNTMPTAIENTTGNMAEFGENVVSSWGHFTNGVSIQWGEFCDSTSSKFSEAKETAKEFCSDKLGGFFETTSLVFSTLWDETGDWFSTKKEEAKTWISGTIDQYFLNLSAAWTTFWDSAFAFFTGAIPNALKSVSSSISGFFSNITSSISGFLSNALSSAGSYLSNGISSITGLSLPAYAEGGFLDSPQLALVGEDGPEAIIPLGEKRRSRGIALWEEAGRQLGVNAYANGGIVGQVVPPIHKSGTGSPMIQVPVTIGNISFQVQMADGVRDEKDILAILKENISDLTEEIALELSKKLAQVFSNMPILG